MEGECYNLPQPDKSKSDLVNECSQVSRVSEYVVYKSSYVWCIRNISFEAIKAAPRALESPIFSASRPELKWRMCLNHVTDVSSRLLRVRVVLLACKEVCAKYRLALLNSESRTCREGSFATMYPADKGKSALAIIPVDYLMRHERKLLHNNTLTILCRISAQLEIPRSGISADLAGLLKNDRFSDVRLVVAGHEFPAHKNLLASRSPVFAAMFESGMLESAENVVEIADVEPEIMRELLRYIYTERPEGLDEIALDLFKAADKYALEELKLMCEDALCMGLNVDNAIEVLVHADLHSADELKKHVKEFIIENAQAVMATPDYKAVGEAHLHLLADIFPRID